MNQTCVEVIGVVIFFFLGFMSGHSTARNKMEKEAIQNKVATYTIDDNGVVSFIWKGESK